MRTALTLAKLVGFAMYMTGTASMTLLFFIVFGRI
jgi:hypothetical protein